MEEIIKKVDAFINSEHKTLSGPQPEWKKTGRDDWQCTWPIEEDHGIIRSSLKLRIPKYGFDNPSVGLIFLGEMIARLDKSRDSECKPNPPYARQLGLPYKVCGPHVHRWEHNKQHIERNNVWELPAREPIKDNMTKIEQMHYWFCDYIQVKIPQEHRSLYLPDRGLWGQEDG